MRVHNREQLQFQARQNEHAACCTQHNRRLLVAPCSRETVCFTSDQPTNAAAQIMKNDCEQANDEEHKPACPEMCSRLRLATVKKQAAAVRPRDRQPRRILIGENIKRGMRREGCKADKPLEFRMRKGEKQANHLRRLLSLPSRARLHSAKSHRRPHLSGQEHKK